MGDLENYDPNDLSRPSVSPTDRRLFLASALAPPLATILANGDEAKTQTRAVKASEANATIAAWIDWAVANGNGKVATLGWCFGGGWSLSAALDAAVIYYGRVAADA
jgi:carboxymethylenebutenolidase